MSEPESGKILKSVVSLEASKIGENDVVTEIMIVVERTDEPDLELQEQMLLLTPNELKKLFEEMRLHYEQGIWSMGTVER